MRQTIKLRPRWIGALVVFISMGTSIHAQVTNTLFFMQGVPQSNRVNPAYQPEGNIYIGIPFLAPMRTSVSSGSLAWEDIVYHNPSILGTIASTEFKSITVAQMAWQESRSTMWFVTSNKALIGFTRAFP